MTDIEPKARAIQAAKDVSENELHMIHICHGAPRCDNNSRKNYEMPCPFCYSIRSDDPRDPDEIMALMRRLHS